MSVKDSHCISFLEKKVSRLKWTNDDLRSKLFEADQRVTRLAQEFGFKDVQHVQDMVALGSLNTNVLELNNRVGILESELHKHVQINKEALEANALMQSEAQLTRHELQQLRSEHLKLKSSKSSLSVPIVTQDPLQENSTRGKPTSVHSSLLNKENNRLPLTHINNSATTLIPPLAHPNINTPSVVMLKSQLEDLQNRYDHLVEVKAKATQRYRQDYRKWRKFKQWLFDKSDKAEVADIMSTRLREVKCRIQAGKLLDPKPNHTDVQVCEGGSETENYSQGLVVKNSDINTEETGSSIQSKSRTAQKIRRPLDDYIEFKGRGRYRESLHDDLGTINSKFEINPDRNGGLNFQYDAVERNPEERRRMHAGDCECCRDYYEVVGPPPLCLQPPLWRTPPSSPQTSIVLARKVEEHDIKDHQKKISRHRHNWDMPATPPQYWSIGFPTTQEVSDINKCAEEIKINKQRAVELESSKICGRYKQK